MLMWFLDIFIGLDWCKCLNEIEGESIEEFLMELPNYTLPDLGIELRTSCSAVATTTRSQLVIICHNYSQGTIL